MQQKTFQCTDKLKIKACCADGGTLDLECVYGQIQTPNNNSNLKVCFESQFTLTDS